MGFDVSEFRKIGETHINNLFSFEIPEYRKLSLLVKSVGLNYDCGSVIFYVDEDGESIKDIVSFIKEFKVFDNIDYTLFSRHVDGKPIVLKLKGVVFHNFTLNSSYDFSYDNEKNTTEIIVNFYYQKLEMSNEPS